MPEHHSRRGLASRAVAPLISLLLGASCSGGDRPPVAPTQFPTQGPTHDPAAGGLVIAAAGDIACETLDAGDDTCHHSATSDLLVDGGFDGALVLGDSQYEDGAFPAFRASFHPTWGRVKQVIRPAVGNHEYGTPGAQGYFRYFGRRAGPRGKGYYSFDLGAWHLVALNSNCGEVACAGGSAQERWLRADLTGSSAGCVLAFWHHPRWSSGTTHGGTDDVAPFVQALYDFGAEIVLVGHEHNYERFAPQDPEGRSDPQKGIRQFVIGTGGRSLYPFGPPEPNSEARQSDVFGILKLTLHSESYAWEFVPEAGRDFTDTGESDCH